MTKDHRTAKGLSTKTKLAFGSFATLSFFVVIEFALACFGVQSTLESEDPYVGFESTVPLFVRKTYQGAPCLETAANKLSYFNSQRFSAEKADNTVRVFCVGGSTTFGRPYDDRTSFAGWLRELLPLADRGKRWEVINAGGISYASYRVVSVMEELAQYSPDLFVIYTGHNEFLEERTYRDVKESAAPLRRITAPLFQTRTYSLAHRLLRPAAPVSEDRDMMPAEVDAILDHSAGPTAYERDDQLRAKVIDHFRFNLDRMIRVARAAGAEVILVTPSGNLKDFSPFKSEHRSDLNATQREEFARLLEVAAESDAGGDGERALSQLRLALEIDDRHADAHFRIGKQLMKLGRYDEARLSLLRAVDEDVCPLRVLPAMQKIVEQTAISNQVPLVDFDGILQNDCLDSLGHNSPGSEYFLDHVHPTVAANRLLALSTVEAMTLNGTITPDTNWGESAIAAASRRVESKIDLDLQTRALTNLAQVLSWAGKQEEAGPLALQAVRLRSSADLNDDPESMYYAAVSLATSGHDARATQLLQRVIELEPVNVDARWRLAVLLYDQLRFQDALLHFREAVQLDPQDAFCHQMLGVTCIKLGRYDDALAALNRAAEIQPESPGLRESISTARKLKGVGSG